MAKQHTGSPFQMTSGLPGSYYPLQIKNHQSSMPDTSNLMWEFSAAFPHVQSKSAAIRSP
eukprot:1161668-Pelagomonas_calceolata.AAC.15